MKHLTYQLIIATVIYSLLSVKFIVCNSENNGKIKAKNAEYNYEDNEMIGNDEDLNEDYGNDDDLEAVVAENENQSKQQDDTDLNNNNNNNKQTESNRLSEIYVSLKKANLNIYRKLSVNDMLININEDENESNNNNLIIKAYYKDDVQYDCELPEEYDSIEAFDWSVNGYMTGMNESSYNIILDKKIDSKNAFLNVSCMFKVLNHSDFFYIHFPIVYLDNYYFQHDISRGEYLKFKYQKQIIILTKSLFVLVTIAILVLFVGLVYRIRIAKRLRKDEENKAFSEQLLE